MKQLCDGSRQECAKLCEQVAALEKVAEKYKRLLEVAKQICMKTLDNGKDGYGGVDYTSYKKLCEVIAEIDAAEEVRK